MGGIPGTIRHYYIHPKSGLDAIKVRWVRSSAELYCQRTAVWRFSMLMSTAFETQMLVVNVTAPLVASVNAIACLKLRPCLFFVCPF